MYPNKYCPPPPHNRVDVIVQQSTSGSKSKAQLNSGNFLNAVPMTVVGQYHHRRKYPTHVEYQ